jgi:LuxR family transcriptional regulator, maltose regulon positive regulatory protein
MDEPSRGIRLEFNEEAMTAELIEALTGALLKEISAPPGELDLVLDDYHRINSEDVHRAVSLLLEHLPEGAHLVVSSRVNPPLPLTRLRARSQMAELGAAELAFSREEAGVFAAAEVQHGART